MKTHEMTLTFREQRGAWMRTWSRRVTVDGRPATRVAAIRRWSDEKPKFRDHYVRMWLEKAGVP
jgi:hypothetical protein